MEQHIKAMLEELKQGTATLLDVREEDEWEQGHLKLARLTPLSHLEEGDIPDDLKADKEKKLYLHCKSGRRVLVAEEILSDEGFKEIVPLEEGFEDLADAGLEVEE